MEGIEKGFTIVAGVLMRPSNLLLTTPTVPSWLLR
jgi:hypothetical protein